MPRSVKGSDEEVETKSGRRTRGSVGDLSLRRSNRIKPLFKQNESSPESPLSDSNSVSNTRSTRGRTSTVDNAMGDTQKSLRSRKNSVSSEISETELAPGTPTKRTRSNALQSSAGTPKANPRVRRLTRAGSEAKSPVSTRHTRRTRASSVEPEGTGGNEIQQDTSVSTLVRPRRRTSVVPTEPTVIEKTEELDKVLVIELDRSLPEIREVNETVKGLHDDAAENLSSESIKIVLEDKSDDEKLLSQSDKKTLESVESCTIDKDVPNPEPQSSNEDTTMEVESITENLNDSLGEDKSSSNKENETINIVRNVTQERSTKSAGSNVLLQSRESTLSNAHDANDKSCNESIESEVCATNVSKTDKNESLIEIDASEKSMADITQTDNESFNEKSKSDGDVSKIIIIETVTQSSTVDNTDKMTGESEALNKSKCVNDDAIDHSDKNAIESQTNEKEIAEQFTENNSTQTSEETDIINISAHTKDDDAMDCSDLIAISVTLTDEPMANISNDAVEFSNISSVCTAAISESSDVTSNLRDLISTNKNTDDVANVVKSSQSSTVTESPAEPTEETENNEELSAKISVSNTSLSLKRKSLSKLESNEGPEDSPATNTSLNFRRKSLPTLENEEESEEISVTNKSFDPIRKSLDKSQNKEEPEETVTRISLSLKRKSLSKLQNKEEMNEIPVLDTPNSKRKSANELEDNKKSEKISEMNISTSSKRKSVDKSKSEENEMESEENQEIPKQNDESIETDDNNSESAANLFQDIPADEWKEKTVEKIANNDSVHSMSTEKLENENEVECDLVLVNRDAWLAAESIKIAKEKQTFDYDSDDTVVLKRKTDFKKSQNSSLDQQSQALVSVIKRKSLNKSKTKETEGNESAESKEKDATTPAKKNEKKLSTSSSLKKKIQFKHLEENAIFNTDESDDESKESVPSADKSSAKKKKLTRNYSTVVHVDSDSDDNVNNVKSESDDNNVTLPKFLFATADSDDDDASSKESVDSDIRREYNLDGKDDIAFSDDDVAGDQCRASESESSDPNDNGSDLNDFIVDDDEVVDEEESEEDAVDEDAEVDIEANEEDKDGEGSEVEENADDEEEKNVKRRKRLIIAEDEEENEAETKIPLIVEEDEELVKEQEKYMEEENESEEGLDNELSLKVTESDSTEEEAEQIPRQKKKKNKRETEDAKKKFKVNVSQEEEMEEDEETCNLSKVSLSNSEKSKKLKQNDYTLPGKINKLNKSMECSTPKTASTKRERFETSIQTSDGGSGSARKKSMNKTIELEEEMEIVSCQEKVVDISLKAEHLKKLNKSKEKNASILHRSLPADSTEFAEKTNLSRPMSTKVIELNKAMLTLYDAYRDASQEDASQEDTSQVTKKRKRFALVSEKNDNIFASTDSENKKKKKKKTLETELFEIKDTQEKITNPETTEVIPDKQKKKKKRKALETEQFEIKDMQDKITDPETTEVIPDKQRKKKKRRAPETEQFEIEDIQEKITDPETSKVIPDKQRKKKKKRALETEQFEIEDMQEKITDPETSEVTPDKKKRKKKTDNVPKFSSAEVEIEAPQTHAFSKTRKAAVESMKRAVENIKAYKEIEKQKKKTQKNRERTKEGSILPSRSMPDSAMKNIHVETSFTPLSTCGSTTHFNVVNLQKMKKQKKVPVVASFRQRMLARNARQPVSAYLMYLEKQKVAGKHKFSE